MKFIKKKSFIAVIVIALIITALGICAAISSTDKDNNNGFKGSYNLTAAYAQANVKQITVADKLVDAIDTAKFNSEDGEYTLCLTVIDLADLGELLGIQVGYEIGEGLYFNGGESGLSNVVYSSLSFANGSLSINELNLGDRFEMPYFIVVEVPTNSFIDKVFNLIVSETHITEKVEGQAATCTQDGWKDYYTCKKDGCNKYFKDLLGIKEIDVEEWKVGDGKIEATGHTEVVDEAVEASCTESGLTAGSHCSVCNTVLVAQEVVNATGHTEVVDEAKAPTCTESGLTAGSHCSTCNTVLVAQEAVNATGHTEVVDKAKAPTCTESGLTEGKHCSTCNTVLVAQEVVNATGHTEVVDGAKEPSCTESGLTAGKHCSTCNTVLVAQEAVNATGHSSVTDSAVAATCTTSGLTEGSHCAECGTVIVAQTEIPALGHTYLDSYEDEYCTVCDDHKAVVKNINGVNYTLNYNTNAETGAISRYFIVSGKADDFYTKYDYNNSANTLVLENEIDGYSVTEIAANAFANTARTSDNKVDANYSIKNVILSKNIKKIGIKAFLDNVGMESVIFLADVVSIDGKYEQGSEGNDTPFYGCSTEVDGITTNLHIYYNTVKYDGKTCDGTTTDLYWTRFRRYKSSLVIYDRCFVGCKPSGSDNVNGGGSAVAKGWNYVTANATVDLKGVTDSELTLDAVNAILAKYYPMISATAYKDSDERKTVEANLTVEFAKYDINKNGITYKCVWEPNIDTVYDDVDCYKVVTYSVSYAESAIINVFSGIDFTYHGTAVQANTTKQVIPDIVNGSIKLATPSAEGYIFLGFASANGTALTFGVGEDIVSAGNTLYIIWGRSKAGTTFAASVNTSGSVPSAPVSNSIDGKWYDNSWNEINESNSLTTDNLIVYTRTKFTFTYKIEGSGTNLTDTMEGTTGKDKGNVNKNDYSYSFDVWEGQTITVTRSSDKYTLTIDVDDTTKGTIKLNKTFILFGYKQYEWKGDDISSGVWTATVTNANLSATFIY